MLYAEKKIELPVNDLGQFILNKEAIRVIKKASSLVARWSKHDPDKCFFRATVDAKIEGEKVNICYAMPINTRGNYAKFAFISHMSIYSHQGTPAFVECLKEGSILFFGGDTGGSQNTDSAGLKWDRVNYTILNGKKFIYGLFDESVTPENSTARLLWDMNA